MSELKRALEIVLAAEGGFTNDPNDPGNWTGGRRGEGELRGTKYGISAMSYPHLDIENLTLDDVVPIYYEDYWQKVKADELPWPLNAFVFDAAVNQGVTAAIKMLQSVLKTRADGIIGKVTRSKMRNASEWHAVQYLTARALRYQGTRHFDKFGKGWLNRLFHLSMEVSKHG